MVSEHKKAYMKDYHRRHREQKAEYNKRYSERHRDKIREYKREWYKRNLRKMREYHRVYKKKRYASDEKFRKKTLERSHKRYRRLREQVLTAQKFYTEDFIFGYVISNIGEFGYRAILPYHNKNFDFFGVKLDGTVERVEIERTPGRFLKSEYHDPSKVDRIIAVFGTRNLFPLPLTVINRDRYKEWLKTLPFLELKNRR